MLQLDSAINTQIVLCTFCKSPVKETSTVNVPFCDEGSIRDTRPSTTPFRVSILRRQPDRYVFDLSFSNLYLRFQPRRIRNSGQVRSGLDARSDFDWNYLDDASASGTYMKRIDLTLFRAYIASNRLTSDSCPAN